MGNKALVVIDEIGSMEIASVKIRSVLRDVMQSEWEFLGTIVKRSLPFTDGIKSPCKNMIVVNPLNHETIADETLLSLSEDQV